MADHVLAHNVEYNVHGGFSGTAVVVVFRLGDTTVVDEGVHLGDAGIDDWDELAANRTKLTLRVVAASGLDCTPQQPLMLDCIRDLQALDDNTRDFCGRERHQLRAKQSGVRGLVWSGLF